MSEFQTSAESIPVSCTEDNNTAHPITSNSDISNPTSSHVVLSKENLLRILSETYDGKHLLNKRDSNLSSGEQGNLCKIIIDN